MSDKVRLRPAVRWFAERFGVSERTVCRVLGWARRGKGMELVRR